MTQLLSVCPSGCPSVRSSARVSAETTSERLMRALIVARSVGSGHAHLYGEITAERAARMAISRWGSARYGCAAAKLRTIDRTMVRLRRRRLSRRPRRCGRRVRGYGRAWQCPACRRRSRVRWRSDRRPRNGRRTRAGRMMRRPLRALEPASMTRQTPSERPSGGMQPGAACVKVATSVGMQTKALEARKSFRTAVRLVRSCAG